MGGCCKLGPPRGPVDKKSYNHYKKVSVVGLRVHQGEGGDPTMEQPPKASLGPCVGCCSLRPRPAEPGQLSSAHLGFFGGVLGFFGVFGFFFLVFGFFGLFWVFWVFFLVFWCLKGVGKWLLT